MEHPNLLEYLESFVSEARKARFTEVLARRTRYLTVALEDVYQLHNTSAVLRSCEVFGLQDLYLIERESGRRPDRKIALGAERWVDLHRYGCTSDCLKMLKSKGYRLVATTPDQNACPLDDFILDEPTALLFGTEKDGLSKDAIRASDSLLKIPMAGFTESLNISVAAAIILYKLTTVMRDSPLPWRLSEVEAEAIRLAWTQKSVKGLPGILERYRKDYG
jgi:tRNA (guanosine-2'-O-)-methyltransferase